MNGSQFAELLYQVLATSGKQVLLEITLITGRPHQIRAQLSSIGCPILGDLKYGAPQALPDASIALHSRELHFVHPVKKEALTLIAPLPTKNWWKPYI